MHRNSISKKYICSSFTDHGFAITTAAPPNSVEAADKSEADGIIAAMNRTLDKVRGIEKQKEELLAALQNLQR